MKSFEPVYKELETLFIEKLPEYIDKVNKEHNDGIILKPFTNTQLEENCIQFPYFNFKIEASAYEEKDRIIENTIYIVSFEIKLEKYIQKRMLLFFRYIEAINKMLEETEIWQQVKITDTKEDKIIVKIIV